jgi:hypothetical protein
MVVTNESSKSKRIRGAGWDIMEKVLKSGYLIPPLIVNYKWTKGDENFQEIRFFPFLMKTNLKSRTANIHGGDRIYNMFDYDLNNLPYFLLYSNSI